MDDVNAVPEVDTMNGARDLKADIIGPQLRCVPGRITVKVEYLDGTIEETTSPPLAQLTPGGPPLIAVGASVIQLNVQALDHGITVAKTLILSAMHDVEHLLSMHGKPINGLCVSIVPDKTR